MDCRSASLFAAVLLLPLLTAACTKEPNAVVVDFSKTVSVERPSQRSEGDRPLRVAVGAMISPKETFVYHRQILDYIGRHLGRRIELIQRKTYGEINELFGKGEIDLGFICSGPYAIARERYGFELLVTPEIHGSHFYQSYLIVNSKSPVRRLEDLRGRVFAFSDPDSNTGRLVPTYWLAQIHETPERFFSKTIFTYSHDNSILAVARELVDGAAVDGLIWEYYQRKKPSFTSKTRVVRKSELYGIPPLVASKGLPAEVKEQVRQVLFSMHLEPEGQRILAELMIDRFSVPADDWYEPILRMSRELGRGGPHS